MPGREKAGKVADLLKNYKRSWLQVSIKTNFTNTQYDVITKQDNFAGKVTTTATFKQK